MKTEISTRQLGIIVFLSFCTMKFINLCSLLYQKVDDVSLVIFVFLLSVDAALTIGILLYVKRNAGKSFYYIISQKYGKIIAKIIYFLIFLYLILKFSIFIAGNFSFLRDAIFSSASILFYLSIIFPVIISLSFSPLKSFSRTFEFFYFLLVGGLLLCVFLAFFSGGFGNLLVSFDISFSSFFNTSLDFNFWFGDCLIILLFMDKIKVEKKFIKTTLFYVLLSCVLVFIFAICFYGVFPETAFMHSYAIYDMSVFGSSTLEIGRLDLIPVITMMFFIILESSLLFRGAMKSLEDFAEANSNKNIGSVILCSFASLLLIIFYFVNDEIIFNFISSEFRWFAFVVGFVLPTFVLFCLIFNKRRKNNAKN